MEKWPRVISENLTVSVSKKKKKASIFFLVFSLSYFLQIISNQSITFDQNITSSGECEIHANYDCMSIGTINLNINSYIESPLLKLIGGDVSLIGLVNILSGSLLFYEMCDSSDSLRFGGNNFSKTKTLKNDFIFFSPF